MAKSVRQNGIVEVDWGGTETGACESQPKQHPAAGDLGLVQLRANQPEITGIIHIDEAAPGNIQETAAYPAGKAGKGYVVGQANVEGVQINAIVDKQIHDHAIGRIQVNGRGIGGKRERSALSRNGASIHSQAENHHNCQAAHQENFQSLVHFRAKQFPVRSKEPCRLGPRAQPAIRMN